MCCCVRVNQRSELLLLSTAIAANQPIPLAHHCHIIAVPPRTSTSTSTAPGFIPTPPPKPPPSSTLSVPTSAKMSLQPRAPLPSMLVSLTTMSLPFSRPLILKRTHTMTIPVPRRSPFHTPLTILDTRSNLPP